MSGPPSFSVTMTASRPTSRRTDSSMMMLPPVMIALPFKLVFFVLVDGWYLVAGSLVRSFGGG